MANIIQIILLLILVWLAASSRGLSVGGGKVRGLGKRRRIILDSCALIDGRIVEVVNSGFVADELIIPQFILSELQLLADGSDSHKRERARFGLDIAHQLQDAAPNTVTIDQTAFPEVSAVDDKLVALAIKLGALLYTTDYNLAKVAAIKAVKVLNINELAQQLRPIALPGETLEIKIIQRGSNRDQGVGYLDDGTMIVVEGGARLVGKTTPVTVTRMHQTMAGKMVFGQVARQHVQQRPAAETSDDEPEVAAKSASAVRQPRERPARAAHPAQPKSQPGSIHARLAKPSTHLRAASRRARRANVDVSL